MNVYKEKLNLIRIALGMAVKMVSAKLEDGVTVVEAEAFEPGKEIFVVSESGEKAKAPEGIHTTEDGTKVTVDAEGKIVSVEAPEAEVEVEAKVHDKDEEEMAEDKVLDPAMVDAMAKIIEEKMKSYKMEVSDVIEAIVKDVIDVKEEMSQCMARIEKMSKTPADKKISTFNTEVKEDKFDAIEARIETLKNIRAGKI